MRIFNYIKGHHISLLHSQPQVDTLDLIKPTNTPVKKEKKTLDDYRGLILELKHCTQGLGDKTVTLYCDVFSHFSQGPSH